jgi:hypothetical protein
VFEKPHTSFLVDHRLEEGIVRDLQDAESCT